MRGCVGVKKVVSFFRFLKNDTIFSGQAGVRRSFGAKKVESFFCFLKNDTIFFGTDRREKEFWS